MAVNLEEDHRGTPPFRAMQGLFADEDETVDYLVDEGCLNIPDVCGQCGAPVTYTPNAKKIIYCHSRQCKATHVRSIFRWSPNTVTDWFRFAQQLIGEMVLESMENYQIGGPGVEVEINEFKFGKRKYHRGHRVEGLGIRWCRKNPRA
ncbi:Inherit from opiNOG: protein Hydra magnipapillata [Seminavis robusta]|uniref:Inherit from opiNOG: protein Hydra magnipapillata n=1 Tax=Seminavis robusta TaxID=568900 RepID=A0A9N8EU99_9STRA|nr:Inherit from opiNOG: protein Hydra magnipapillata [Seminavis robusta]|eukprot:Sro1781_g297110.1 Inherit from opiNOG: protein Hydra magnipapillata (148) ;mRNA; r:16751-17310